jgi:hypothetical protein
MTAHVFADESKARGYLLAAAVVKPENLGQARRQVGALRLPRQRRIHFAKEQDSRRRSIISAFSVVPAKVTLYDASKHTSEQSARRACLEQLVDDLTKIGARLLVLEQDDSLIESDRRLLYSRVRAAGCEETLRYEHKRAGEECLLAIPDAIAWCWARGGDWRRRAEPLVVEVVTL